MSLHTSKGYCLQVFICFLLFYTLLPILTVSFGIIIFYRKFLSWIICKHYGNKYSLTTSLETLFSATDFFGNLYTSSMFIYIEGPCDIHELQRRVQMCLQWEDKNAKPYSKLTKRTVKKWGFIWWEDQSESFDITHHVRYFPDDQDKSRVYTEAEMFENISKIADIPWDWSRPKWEMLVTPQVKLQDNYKVCSVVTFRLAHEYMDGISLMQMVRNFLMDPPSPRMTIDPLNVLKEPEMTMYKKLILYGKLFILGPHYLLMTKVLKEKNILMEKGLTDRKYFGRTTISDGMMTRIRRQYKCSTLAVINSAYAGALLDMSKRKNLSLSKEVAAAQLLAHFPYPNEHPQNRFYLLYDKFPVGDEVPIERLMEFEKRLQIMSKLEYIHLHSRGTRELLGLLPAFIVKALYTVLASVYLVSIIPFPILRNARFNKCSVHDLFCMSPVANGTRYVITGGSDKEKFHFGFLCTHSKIISSKEDHKELIRRFEDQLRILADNNNKNFL